MADVSSARDRAIEAAAHALYERAGTGADEGLDTATSLQRYPMWEKLDDDARELWRRHVHAVLARIDRALAVEAAAPDTPPADIREEWAAWEDTHTDDPNDEAARARPLTDRDDAEDYVTMPKARRRRIARRTVTRSRWVAVDTAPETTEETETDGR